MCRVSDCGVLKLSMNPGCRVVSVGPRGVWPAVVRCCGASPVRTPTERSIFQCFGEYSDGIFTEVNVVVQAV